MKNIIETAMGNSDLSTLVSAIKKANLVETLSGTGPFTVFAPTNEAFAKISPEKLKSVLDDKEKLTSILTYHVVAGKVTSKEILEITEAKTVQGSKIKVTVKDGNVFINDSKITKKDIECSNGIVHMIDSVLMP